MHKINRAGLLASSAFALVMLASRAVWAQAAPPETVSGSVGAPPGASAPTASPADSGDTVANKQANRVSEVVVTGTRIARPDLKANNPVAVIDRRAIEVSGITDVADLLQREPQVGIGQNASNTTNTVRNQGIETISLRNLGSNRTLTLVDGHRQVGGGAGSSAVDVNTISTSLLDRVDIVTGGSSALYGADAVAGVVNYVLSRDYEGVGFKAQYGDTQDGGGASYYGSVIFGHNFDEGRGNVTFSAVYNQTDPIYRYQRDYALSELAGVPNPARSTNPAIVNAPAFIPLTGVTTNVYGALNTPQLGTYPAIVTALAGNPGLSLTFGPGGQSVVPFNRGTILLSNTGTKQSSSINCPSCFYSYLDSLQVGAQRRGFETTDHYEIVRDMGIFKNVEAYAEGKYYETDSRTQSSTGTFEGTSAGYATAGGAVGLPSAGAAIPIFLDNAYIPANLRTILNGTPLTSLLTYGGKAGNPRVFYISRIDNDLGDRYSKTHYQMGEGVVGFRGQFKNDWKFDFFYNYGETDSTGISYDRNNILFFQQVDAVVNRTNGQVVCRSSLTNASNGCVPINLFNNGGNSAQAVNYAYGPTFDHDRITLSNAQANVNGTLFHLKSLGSGSDLPIAFAAGYEFRRETSKAVPDIRNQQGIEFGNNSAYTAGHYSTNEEYVELNVPVLADLPLIKRLQFDGSVRVQDYTTTGTDVTYGANADYQVTSDIRLRGVYSIAVRAPNINELFSAGNQSFNGITDPCDATQVNLGVQPINRLANCKLLLGALAAGPNGAYSFTQSPATKSNYTVGNPHLSPERATTYTAGFVFTPRFFRNFTATADYYDISITNEIGSLSLASVVNDCVDSPTLSNPFCSQITRGLDGNVLNVNNSVFNIASFATRGVDFGLSYVLPLEMMRLPDWGRLTFNVNGTYVNNLLFFPVAGDNTTRQQGAGALNFDQPRFRGTARVTYDYRNITASYAVEYIGPMNLSNQDRPLDYAYERVPEYASHDLRIEYRFTGQERFVRQLKGVNAYFGINNFTNEQPPFIPGVFTGTGTGSIYGPIGRFFYGGLTGHF